MRKEKLNVNQVVRNKVTGDILVTLKENVIGDTKTYVAVKTNSKEETDEFLEKGLPEGAETVEINEQNCICFRLLDDLNRPTMPNATEFAIGENGELLYQDKALEMGEIKVLQILGFVTGKVVLLVERNEERFLYMYDTFKNKFESHLRVSNEKFKEVFREGDDCFFLASENVSEEVVKINGEEVSVKKDNGGQLIKVTPVEMEALVPSDYVLPITTQAYSSIKEKLYIRVVEKKERMTDDEGNSFFVAKPIDGCAILVVGTTYDLEVEKVVTDLDRDVHLLYAEYYKAPIYISEKEMRVDDGVTNARFRNSNPDVLEKILNYPVLVDMTSTREKGGACTVYTFAKNVTKGTVSTPEVVQIKATEYFDRGFIVEVL